MIARDIVTTRFSTYLYLVAGLIMAMSLSGCNAQKKNTAAARQYTAFITRYNIHYNGDTHFKETLGAMERNYEDDYSQLVLMHPIEAKSNDKAPQPSGDFTRSIEKAQKAIQIRSIKKKPRRKAGKGNDPEYKAWLKRDEYNPFLHNSWMLMGRSQYFNGDFLGAASTFFYVSKHFTWLPATVTEAKLWQARSYVSLDWLYEAELILTRIKPDQLSSSDLRTLYAFTYADYYIKSKEYEKAVPLLLDAIKGASGAQKTRLRFLLGQVYSLLGEKEKAYKAFGDAGGASSASYRTKFNARIKQSEVFSGSDIEKEVNALRRMTRYDRNKDYLDQVYYAIGNLYLSRGDTAHAIENYILAAEKSTRSGIDKAISQITLGKIYYARRDYEKAQPCFAEAVPLLPETYPDYALLKRRSDVLDELAVYSQNVNLQDSLLRLSEMPEAELEKVIDKIIKDLKEKEKKEADEARREEYMAQQQAQGNTLQDNNNREFSINTDNSWYFYNTTTRNSGKTEFQKRWGSRKLEDDWRRRNKSTFNTADFDADTEDADAENADASAENAPSEEKAEDAKAAEAASDPHNPEYYLAQIPFTPEEKAQSNEIIQEGLYNMGVILKDKLDDFPAASAEFDRLLKDYPDNVYRLDVYYNMYLMAMRQGRGADAEIWRKLILTDFPDSKYGLAMRDPNYIENLKQMDTCQQQLYDRTWQAYLDNRNAEVHAAYEQMMEQYPLSKIMPKFMFLDALAYVTEKQPDKFNAVLRDLLDRYPSTDITPIASAWLKGMAQGRQLQSPESGANLRGMLWDIRLGNDSTATAEGDVNFTINDDDPQLLVLVYPTDKVSANELLYQVARHNFRSFVVKDFDLEPMNFGRLGLLVIKGFDNKRELNHYRSVMAASSDFKLPAGVNPIAISAENFDTLLREGRSFDDYFRFLQEHNYIDAQDGILQPEEIETLPEAEEAEADRQTSNDESHKTNDELQMTNDESSTPILPNSPTPQLPAPPTSPLPNPQTPTLPSTPAYEPGSEGDDPLLE